MARMRGFGVNDLGTAWIKASKENRKVYDLYSDVLRRCFPTTKTERAKHPHPKTISEDWQFLSNFVRDIREMDHYQEMIDGIKGERVSLLTRTGHYSKEDCYISSKSIRIKEGIELVDRLMKKEGEKS